MPELWLLAISSFFVVIIICLKSFFFPIYWKSFVKFSWNISVKTKKKASLTIGTYALWQICWTSRVPTIVHCCGRRGNKKKKICVFLPFWYKANLVCVQFWTTLASSLWQSNRRKFELLHAVCRACEFDIKVLTQSGIDFSYLMLALHQSNRLLWHQSSLISSKPSNQKTNSVLCCVPSVTQ